MDIFAGNFSLASQAIIPDNFDFDIMQTGPKSYFIMGADESLKSSKDVSKFLSSAFGELASYDISIEGEYDLEIISSEYEHGSYECVSFEGANVDFTDILERFADSLEVICVRQGQQSLIYGNKIIKVDFIY